LAEFVLVSHSSAALRKYLFCEIVTFLTRNSNNILEIPFLCQGKDIIGLAETGSGKTGAFALPILHALLENPQKLYALVLTPTRELAFQVALISKTPVLRIRDILIRIRIHGSRSLDLYTG
jgi:hypothetical protein